MTNATVAGATLTIHWYEVLDTTSVPETSTFAVNVNGTTQGEITRGSGRRCAVVTLTLATAVKSTDAVTVGYTPPSRSRRQ